MAPDVAVASSTAPYRSLVVMLEAWMLYGSCCGSGLQYSTVQASSSADSVEVAPTILGQCRPGPRGWPTRLDPFTKDLSGAF